MAGGTISDLSEASSPTSSSDIDSLDAVPSTDVESAESLAADQTRGRP